MSNLLPLFLDLNGQPVLLVGAGSVALAKLAPLLRAGAAITVVALVVSAPVQALAAANPRQIRLKARAATQGDLQGQRLVISATNDPETNAGLARHARELGIWFNAVDDSRHCEFHVAASLNRGPYQIAIGTKGTFPGLSGALRGFLEEVLPEEDGDLLRELAELRTRLRRDVGHRETRTQVLRRVLEGLKVVYFRALDALAELS